MAIRAVIVEGEPFLLEALCDFLEGCGVDVVLRARDAAAALRVMAGVNPDVVILGSGTETGCGPDPARTIIDAFPAISVVTLQVPGAGSALNLTPVAAGGRAVQLDGDPATLIEAVREVGARTQYRLTWS
jgi:DNA-binding NarL/FixJ family response regulator